MSYLHINVDRWLLSHEMDYAGVLIIRGVYFLLRGNVESCGLLKKCEGVGDRIRLQRPVSNDFKLFYKCLPDFGGYYQACKKGYLYFNITVESNIGAYFRTRPLKVRKGRK